MFLYLILKNYNLELEKFTLTAWRMSQIITFTQNGQDVVESWRSTSDEEAV